MNQVLVDANVFISFLSDRNASQREKASDLIRSAVEHEQMLVIHSMSLVEMIYVLTQLYHQDATDVAEDVSDLLALPGVISIDDVSWSLVFERWPETISALGDAMLAAAAAHGRFDAVATFDRNLAKKLIRQGTQLYWQ
jgi:predicted nucleic acid-binding protein